LVPVHELFCELAHPANVTPARSVARPKPAMTFFRSARSIDIHLLPVGSFGASVSLLLDEERTTPIITKFPYRPMGPSGLNLCPEKRETYRTR